MEIAFAPELLAGWTPNELERQGHGSGMIRILHIDENSADRDRLMKIAPAESFVIIGSHSGIEDAMTSGGELASSDIIVLGTTGGRTIADSIKSLKAAATVKPIVVLIDHLSLDSLGAAFEAGAMGYLIKSISQEALFESIMLVILGEKVFPAQLADMLVEKTPHELTPGLAERRRTMTAKELQVMQYVKLGYSNKQIARVLGIADITVRLHINNAFRKMNVKNRIQGALWMIEHESELSYGTEKQRNTQ
jgi:two-component system nitrate/nitrite response regulator NarL